MASRRNGTLYTGVTSDIVKRIHEHKTNAIVGFTNKYSVHLLVWFEVGDDIQSVIEREKQIKGWTRKKKLALIESVNPEWRDLYFDLV